jgi:ABC-type xylose transport system permease subunit
LTKNKDRLKEINIIIKIKQMWSFIISTLAYPFVAYYLKKWLDDYFGIEAGFLVMVIASIICFFIGWLISLTGH